MPKMCLSFVALYSKSHFFPQRIISGFVWVDCLACGGGSATPPPPPPGAVQQNPGPHVCFSDIPPPSVMVARSPTGHSAYAHSLDVALAVMMIILHAGLLVGLLWAIFMDASKLFAAKVTNAVTKRRRAIADSGSLAGMMEWHAGE